MVGFRHHPIEVDGQAARQGKTGFHLRYVLAFGIAGVVIAFAILAIVQG
jgi:hypothetical protein